MNKEKLQNSILAHSDLPIGVFDSGVGGLTVLRSLEKLLPQESFIYLGDMARLPYGVKSPDIITRYTQQAAQFLINKGIKLLVIACNTASSMALTTLQTDYREIPIVGVLEPGAKAASLATKNGQIAVIATEATVKAGGYQKAIKQYLPQAQIKAKGCSLLVALAEEGWVDNPITVAVARHYLEPLLSQNNFKPDCLVLACTHFPVLLPDITQVTHKDITIVDSATATAEVVKDLLQEKSLTNSGKAKRTTQFLVTDAPERFANTANSFLGRKININDINLIDLL